MAKKHLLKATELLLEKYNKAQNLYELVAEYFSSEMVDPKELDLFNKIKSKVDSSLSSMSTLLSEAYLHPKKFLEHWEKSVKAADEFEKLENNLSFSIDVRKKYHEMFNTNASAILFSARVNQLRCFPKAKKRMKRHLGSIREANKFLEDLYERTLSGFHIEVWMQKLEKFVEEGSDEGSL